MKKDQLGAGPLPAGSEAEREEAIFHNALALAAADRADFLLQACGPDTALRQRVERLLQAAQQAGDFLDRAASAAAQTRTAPVLAPVVERIGDVIGRYKLRELLGEGGCGIVYVADQTEPVRRRVALKILKLGMDTRSVIARFEAERQALALMDHPNIAKVLDAGATATGRPYFVMELVRGIRITDYCDQNQLDTRQRLELFIQVCHAVQHAHQKAIIHRDLKPSNILVTLHDGVPVPKIIDFGIAKATEGRLTNLTVYTELNQFIGTPAYMSPEQAEMSGLDIDTRSDIYSLGVLLYELLTGQTPFDPSTLARAGLYEMRRTLRELDPPKPSTRLSAMVKDDLTAAARRRGAEPPKLIHTIRGDLDWIVMKALEKDRTRRYDTANAIAQDARRFLDNEAVEARPPSNLYRFQKLVRRNKGVFAAVAAVIASLILGLGVAIHLYLKQNEALQRAVAAEQEQARLRADAEMGLAISQKITLAGDLISRGRVAEAEALMREVPPFPPTFIIFNAIGYCYSIQRQWPGAVANYSKSIAVNPADFRAYHCMAPALVELERTGEYREHCDRLLRQFETISDPLVAARMAQDCLLLPIQSGSSISPAVFALADTALAAGPNHEARAFFEGVKGLSEFRQGRFGEAVRWLEKPAVFQENPSVALAANAVLAMAQADLGRPDEAQSALVRASGIADALASVLESQESNEQLAGRLLLREAQRQIQSKAPDISPAK